MKRFFAFPGLWASAATCASGLLWLVSASQADPVTWGDSTTADDFSILNASKILTTGIASFGSVNGAFDLQVTTTNLNQTGAGYIPTLNESVWWFEGGTRSTTNQSIAYSTVQLNFYAAGTNDNPGGPTPIAVTGLHFVLEDAESEERFRNLTFLDAAGQAITVRYDSPFLTYSTTSGPVVHASDGSFDSGAHYEGGTQTGKWIDINFGNTPVSGFTLQAGRSLSSYGSVAMSGLGDLTPFAFTNASVTGGVSVASGQSYADLGAVASSGRGTVARILQGNASTDRTVAMNFTSGAPFQTSPTTSPSNNDTLTLSGTSGDKFVLELSYDPSTLAPGTDESTLYLSWYNPVTMALDFANAGNTDLPGEPNDTTTPEFQGAYDPSTEFVLGYYGVDTVNHTVWAVIDHNSDFTVVPAPEPTSAVLTACGALPLLLRRRRRSVA